MQKPMRQPPWQLRKSEYFVKIDGFVKSQFLFAKGKEAIMNEKESQPKEPKTAKQSRRTFLKTGAAAAGAVTASAAAASAITFEGRLRCAPTQRSHQCLGSR